MTLCVRLQERLLWPKMKGRGGARHRAAPEVDKSLLLQLFGEFLNVLSDLGGYERRSRADAVDGAALVASRPFLDRLLDICPTAELKGVSCKAALLDLVTENPAINRTQYKNIVFAGMRQERLCTIMNHLRRLKREKSRLKQCLGNLTRNQTELLVGLVAKVKQPVFSYEIDDDENTQYWPAPEDKKGEADEVAAPATKRKLMPKVSDASVDDQGFPTLLASQAVPNDEDLDACAEDAMLKRGRLETPQTFQEKMGFRSITKGSGASSSRDPLPAAESRAKRARDSQAAPANTTEKQAWGTMYYKAHHSVAVREKRGRKRQLFCISNKTWAKARLEEVAQMAIWKLEQGEPAEAVKAWGKNAVKGS